MTCTSKIMFKKKKKQKTQNNYFLFIVKFDSHAVISPGDVNVDTLDCAVNIKRTVEDKISSVTDNPSAVDKVVTVRVFFLGERGEYKTCFQPPEYKPKALSPHHTQLQRGDHDKTAGSLGYAHKTVRFFLPVSVLTLLICLGISFNVWSLICA